MAYTPELKRKYSGTLRRIAWTYEITMRRALECILDYVTRYMDHKNVCDACRDKSFCEFCPFKE